MGKLTDQVRADLTESMKARQADRTSTLRMLQAALKNEQIELKRELYDMLSSDVARQLKRRRVSENDVLEDFKASRKRRRATRRRR